MPSGTFRPYDARYICLPSIKARWEHTGTFRKTYASVP